MTANENRRETGATKYPAKNDPDPSDNFSQDAAGNKKPASGLGLNSGRRRRGRKDPPVRRTEPG